VDDLLPALLVLRLAYSGLEISGPIWDELLKPQQRFKSNNGYVLLNNKLMMMMGSRATAHMRQLKRQAIE